MVVKIDNGATPLSRLLPLLLLWPLSALAEGLVPPVLLALPQATYPASQLASRVTAQVVLALTLDETGAVVEVEVAQGAGGDFDQAAREAALQARFLPARQHDVPVACRIQLAIEFQPPVVEPAVLEPLPVETTEAPVRPGFEVRVRGASEARRMERSAQAVTVLETKEAKKQTADLGEVVARTEGVGVRRGGGLGSGTRFSLNGLTDDQVRFLLDGVPLDLAGYPFGLANVPVNLIERVEIFRGVVPIRFGADALGGAVNLVSEHRVKGSQAQASYQFGSFGTHRATLSARHLHEPTGLFVRASGFFDHADNDYEVDVEIPNRRGKLESATVPRFHDGYQAMGAQLEAGFVERPWARRLLVRGFVTTSEKELQHNIVMSVPYGEATYGRAATGASLLYEQDLGRDVSVHLVGGYAFNEVTFEDLATCIYDWHGQCGLPRTRPGEISGQPIDQVQWQHTGYARLNLQWRPVDGHALRLALAPNVVKRTGEDRTPRPDNTRDPLSAVQRLDSLVTGVEYQANVLDDRLENLTFVKGYLRQASAVEPLPTGGEITHDSRTQRFGVGHALRYRIIEGLQAKASYEWATRLPRPDEVFGDGVLIGANPTLEPESSHNLNLGLSVERGFERTGTWRGDVNGFVRRASQLIVLVGAGEAFSYQNVYGALSTGVEASASWTSPARLLTLGANGTWQDFRNDSTEGAYGAFAGDRIPNRPYLFANASARLQKESLFTGADELSLAWHLRYVHSFFRSWESVGLRSSKQIVPSQSMQSLALTYSLPVSFTSLSFTAEVQNLADQTVYDFFGTQRPGRAFFLKTTASL